MPNTIGMGRIRNQEAFESSSNDPGCPTPMRRSLGSGDDQLIWPERETRSQAGYPRVSPYPPPMSRLANVQP